MKTPPATSSIRIGFKLNIPFRPGRPPSDHATVTASDSLSRLRGPAAVRDGPGASGAGRTEQLTRSEPVPASACLPESVTQRLPPVTPASAGGAGNFLKLTST